MMNQVKALTATEYALVLGVVSLTLVAGFETFVRAFSDVDAGVDGILGTEDDVATGIFPALVSKLAGIAENI